MCTNISFPIKYKDDPLISARTMDFVQVMKTVVCVESRNQSFPKIPLPGEITWTNPYGFVGFSCTLPGTSVSGYADGLNEEGLSAASLWLDCFSYMEPKRNTSLLFHHNLVSYVLGNFKKVAEVKAALSKLTIVNATEYLPLMKAPLHFIFSDASGDHLIVEFINGEMKSYFNKVGVLTNDPSFDWHLTNLNNYENLKLVNNPKQIVGGEYYGSGQLGNPGDPTSSSRFIRADLLRRSSFEPKNVQQSVGLAFQVIQTLAVPCGTSILVGTDNEYDWTQWSVIRDHTNRSVYFFTAFNSRLYGIHLKKLDLDAPQRKTIEIIQPAWYVDVTKRLDIDGT